MSIGTRFEGSDTDIVSVEYDSRKVRPGSLFCCIRGEVADGHSFAEQAVSAGASALLCEYRLPLEVPQIIVGDSRKGMAEIASAFYNYPQREMIMLGVTGTNGKTTTTYMIKSIAEHYGKKVGIIGTIRNMIGSESVQTERTTPESVDLFALLRRMADAKCDIVVMEVSSHALEQSRVHGIRFDAALFTNLTQDHLDYHKTFDNYLNAKKILFYNADRRVINLDDPYARRIMEGIDTPVLTFGVKEQADICAKEIEISTAGVRFMLHTPEKDCRMNIPIPGLFSVFNAMGSVGLALSIGIPLDVIREGLESMTSVSGRMDPVTAGMDVPYSVFVDYAHTPDALENVLKTVHEFAKKRVITVFGCGGNRDRAKRPIMGSIAARLSDIAIITSDNPRNENPMDIIDSIAEGVKPTGVKYVIIENRRDAIRHALSIAEPGDVVMIAGKGHENYQEINGVKHHFDDKEIVTEFITENK